VLGIRPVYARCAPVGGPLYDRCVTGARPVPAAGLELRRALPRRDLRLRLLLVLVQQILRLGRVAAVVVVAVVVWER
jgi:hypothetical protein